MQYDKFLILGGDLRNIALAGHLAAEGKKIKAYGFNNYKGLGDESYKSNSTDALEELIANAEIVVGATPCCKNKNIANAPFCDEDIDVTKVLDLMDTQQVFIAGSISPEIMQYARKRGIKIYDILQREEMAVLNAIPTAEGAIQLAMEKMKITLHSSNALILGYGRIGKILAKMLHGIGANVYVAARKPKDIAAVRSYGHTPIQYDKLNSYLFKMDVIFNTVPHIILDKSNLTLINKSCLIIDMASSPHGVDFEAAKIEKLDAINAPSLPGKVAPVTAASYIKETIYNILNEEEA